MTILTYGLGDRQNEGDHPFLDRSDGQSEVETDLQLCAI